MSKHLDKLTRVELQTEKSRLNSLVYKIVIGTLIYAGVIFYLMYNGNKATGNYLIAVPVVMFVVAYYYGASLKTITTELNKRR